MAWFNREAPTEEPTNPGGAIWAWGENHHGQLGSGVLEPQVRPALVDLPNVKKVVAGTECALALQTDGTVWSWGFNDFGKLGDGTEQDRAAPVRLASLPGAVDLAAGARTSYALMSDGTVRAWGGNPFHELGVGAESDRITPRSQSDGFAVRAMNDAEVGTPAPAVVSRLSNIQSISAGGSRAFALDSAGTVWAWGDNQRGRLGDGSTYEHLTPVPIRGLPRIVAIAAAETAAFALDGSGRVWAWGDNQSGQLGDGTQEDRYTPVMTTGLNSIKSIAAGHSSAFALGSDGKVWAWGRNRQGQLGIGTQDDAAVPTVVAGLSNVISLAAGWAAAYAVIDDGSVWAWGDNGSGQLGDPSRADSLVPAPLPGFAGIVDIAARKNSAYALATHTDGASAYSPPTGSAQPAVASSQEPGSVWAWGSNHNAKLGDGSRDDRLVPTLVAGLSDVTEISFTGGRGFSNDGRVRALLSDGTVWAWGGNIVNNALDGSRVPEQVEGVAEIVALRDGFAVKSDGTVWDLRVVYLNESPEQVPDFADATSVYPIEPLLYVAQGDGTIAVAEQDNYSWDHKGSYYWRNKQRQLAGPEGITTIVSWTDAGTENTWEEGFYRLDVALAKDGSVWQWRVENLGTDVPNKSMSPFAVKGDPYPLAGLTEVTSIASGADYCAALTQHGTVWTWGKNDHGQLGDGTDVSRPTPGIVDGLPTIVALEPFDQSCFALAADGSVWAWGRNDGGQLGDGSSQGRLQPVILPGLSDVRCLHAGFAIRQDGTVWAWGRNDAGRLADGTEASRSTPQEIPGLIDIAAMASRGSTWFAITKPAGNGKPLG